MVDSKFETEFEKVDSGASDAIPLSVADIKKGTHILMGENRPCKVMEITTSKTGKHGHAKANITGIDIFNGKKYQDVCPVSHAKEAPNIKREEWTVMSVDDEGYIALVDKTGKMRQDLKLPNETDDDLEVAKKVTDGLESGKTILVTVLSAMKIEKIEDAKESLEN
jgi:translation initiation factor 5A